MMYVKRMFLAPLAAIVLCSTTIAGAPEKGRQKAAQPSSNEVESSIPKLDVISSLETLPRCATVAREKLEGLEASSSALVLLDEARAESPPSLSGDLHTDLLAISADKGDVSGNQVARDGRRNPALAFGMSALVPGLGQAYNKSWIRAAVAGGLEIALWTGYFTWRSSGFDGRDNYQAYAHQNWSVRSYGEWLNQYPGYSGTALDVVSIQDVDFTNPGGWSADQQLRVNAFFEELRAAERVARYNNADGTGTGATFSHVLPNFGDQQYYELIGKYYQYGAGWSDWCAGRDPNDPSCFSVEGYEQRDVFEQKTTQFFDYAEDHADANSLLRRASRITSIVVANHALAALDALLTARFHNRGLDVESSVSLRQGPDGSVSPVANLRMTF